MPQGSVVGPAPGIAASDERTASPFRILVKHFFGRFFDTESLSPQADPTVNLGPILGMVAVPGAFLVFMIQVLTLRGWGLVTFRYYFIAFPFLIMAFLVVMKWDALFPDRRDYQILTPLPVRPVTMFLAKISAMALLLAIFLIAVNFFGALFWPGVDTRPGAAKVFLVHIAAACTAGIFGAVAAAAIQGLMVVSLSGNALRRISPVVQTVLLGALIALFFLTRHIAEDTAPMVFRKSPLLDWLPTMWFLGLYERWLPATRHPILLEMGAFAMQAMAVAAAAFALTYVPGYRRSSRKMLESPPAQSAGAARVASLFNRLLHRLLLRSPVERAVFHFINQTIARSMKHRLFIAVYTGFGSSVAIVSVNRDEDGLLRLPLILSFVMISGLRAAFNFPSELRANWAFQLSENGYTREYVGAVRKWIVVCAVIPLFAAMSVVEIYSFSARAAVFHVAYGIGLTLLLVEILFFDLRKVPFTCAYLPGKVNMVGLAAVYVFGFTTYSNVMSVLEKWLTRNLGWGGLFLLVIAALVLTLRMVQMRRQSAGAKLEWEDDNPAIRELGLSAG